jgi:peptide deformylase
MTPILLLGDPRLYEVCDPVTEADRPLVAGWVADLHAAMQEVRARYGFGRAIAAPQLGIMKRLIYMNTPGTGPVVFINPMLTDLSPERFELWDDCMSFPNLLVRVSRHESLTINYLDENFVPKTWPVTGDLSELLQHEYDHLDGILCTMRALDERSFRYRDL